MTTPKSKARKNGKARVMYADMQTESTQSCLTLHRFKARIEEHADAWSAPCKPVAFSVLPRSKEAQEAMIEQGAAAAVNHDAGIGYIRARNIAIAVLASANLVEKE